MRLLIVRTRKLKEFNDDAVTPYAILSHTWDTREVTFKELSRDPRGFSSGHRKINSCCRQAIKDGYDFVWIDTCCIDKSSSAELSEAINSMFKWYSAAQICYIYLSDVPARDDASALNSSFRKSRWFRRGWTLQELLAPNNILFFDATWQPVVAFRDLLNLDVDNPHDSGIARLPNSDPETEDKLMELLSEITGISIRHIEKLPAGPINLPYASIAEKMSWAADRNTTRIEDTAYCLLGIFDVNMPTIYGEGSKAFRRLQEEIIKQSSDHSIFAWNYGFGLHHTSEDSGFIERQRGLFATSPAEFKYCSEVMRCEDFDSAVLSHYAMTNCGLQMEMILWRPILDIPLVYAVLNCVTTESEPLRHLLMPLIIKRWESPRDPLGRLVLKRLSYEPIQAVDIRPFENQLRRLTVYVEDLEQKNMFTSAGLDLGYGPSFEIRTPTSVDQELTLLDAFPFEHLRTQARTRHFMKSRFYQSPYPSSLYLLLFSSKTVRILVAVDVSKEGSWWIAAKQWYEDFNLLELVARQPLLDIRRSFDWQNRNGPFVLPFGYLIFKEQNGLSLITIEAIIEPLKGDVYIDGLT